MKKLTFLTICLLLITCRADAWMGSVEMGGGVAASGGSCIDGTGDAWTNSETGDYWTINAFFDNNYQNVANVSSIEICTIKAILYSSDSGTVHFEVWDTSVTTQYGSDSSTITITDSSGPGTLYTATFSAPYPNPVGDFRVYPVTESGNVVINSSLSENKYFGGSSYDCVTAGTDRNVDFAMTIGYRQ